VENVLAQKGKTWQEQVSFNFRYVAQRVRRRIPPRKMLHLRVKAVCNYFMNETDSRTGKALFNKVAKDMASNVIAALCRGELSDPPGISWHTPLLMTDGKPKMDKDGLHLWRCFRGTGCTEGAHGQFTRAFGHKRAGPMHPVSVLINHHFRQSWRASQRHRPNFPRIHHCDGALVDSVNASYMRLLGKLRYAGWPISTRAFQCISLPLG
jgi:hypothetical protein